MTGLQISLHLRPTQIQIAEFKADFLPRRSLPLQAGHRERQLTPHTIQQLNLIRKNFNLSRRQLLVQRLLGALLHRPHHLHHVLATQRIRLLKRLRQIRIRRHLTNPRAITQVNKNHTAMIAPAIDPTKQGNGLTNVLSAEVAAIVGSHGGLRERDK